MARELDVSPRTLSDWEKAGLVPKGHKIGGKRLYRVTAVFDAIEACDDSSTPSLDPISERIRTAGLALRRPQQDGEIT